MPRSGAPLGDFQSLMRDTLTVELLTPGALDANTSAPVGMPVIQTVIPPYGHVGPWLCSDQDVDARTRAQMIVNGVAGALPVSRARTPWFSWPVVPAGGELIIRVNGRRRPLLKEGPPTDSGGQGLVYVLELGPPQDR